MIRTMVQLRDEQARALKEAAAQEKESISEIIRRAVDDWLKRAKSVPPAVRKHRAMRVVGRFRSGSEDVSERHDDYLNEAYGE